MGIQRRWLAFGMALLLALVPARARAAESVVAPAPLAPLDVAYPTGAQGDAEVQLELLIAEDGTVASTTVRSGPEPFAQAARLEASHFRFSPATRGGIPVRARVAVRIVFKQPVAAPPAPPPAQTAAPALAATEPASTPAAPPAPAEPAAPVELVVLGEQRAELGSIHIPREEARRVPGAFGDPFRVVEVLPGVAPVLSGLPYFYVRGAPPGSVGYFIDGIRVPLLFHVGPGPSVITPLLIDRVDLYPGAYPARIGRYAGAALAGETSAPHDRSHAEAQARVFDASAAVEQPFADGRGNVLVGGRYSYTQAILAAVAPDYKLGYGDYQARVGYALSREDRLSVFAFGGYDFLRNQTERHTLFDVAFHRVDLRWDRQRSDGRQRVGLTFSNDRVLSSPDDLGAFDTVQTRTGLRARWELEQDLHRRARLRVGADLGADRVSGDAEDTGGGLRLFSPRTDWSGGLWSDLIWQPARGVELVPGARFDQARSRGADFTFFEPRLAVRARVARGVAYLAGFGLAHQLPADATRMPGRTPTALERSQQAAAQATQGLEYALPDGMLGRTTLFYQHVDIELPGVHGRSYGVEQFFRRDFTHRLGGFLSYTLSRAEGVDGRERVLSTFDRTHVITAVLGYDFGAGYRLGARGYFASGRAQRLFCPTPDCSPGNPGAPFGYRRDLRFPSFFRLDLRFEKRWTLPSGFYFTGTFEWFNALLASEVEQIQYTPRGLGYRRQSPLTLPSLGVELGW